MSEKTSPQFYKVLAEALELALSERLAMIEELAASVKGQLDNAAASEETSFSPEEIAELTQVDPRTPSQVVAEGLLGTWTGISDGAEWVNEQKRKRMSV